jgi:Flp pilus assembly pilin Flp
MIAIWKRLSESGATSLEYALIASLISVAIYAGADLLGGSVQGFFGYAAEKVEESAPD